jgi:cold shock protein
MLDFDVGTPYTGPSFRPAPEFSSVVERWPNEQRPTASYVGTRLTSRLGMVPGLRASEDTVMPTGTIARLLIDKGFGFIRDEGGTEHFFHRSAVRGAVFELLREGQRVEFQPEESSKGPRAGDIRLIEG